MDQPLRMGFEQRPADLQQNMNGPGLGLSPVIVDQLLQVDAVEVFHHIVEHSLGSATVIVDRDCVGVVLLAGDLDLSFEPSDRGVVHFVGVQRPDRGGTAQHRVVAFVHDSHRAFAEFLIQCVLAQLLSFDHRFPRLHQLPWSSAAIETGDGRGENRVSYHRRGLARTSSEWNANGVGPATLPTGKALRQSGCC